MKKYISILAVMAAALLSATSCIQDLNIEPVDDDVVLVEPADSLDAVPDNKIVVVCFAAGSIPGDRVVCKRFRRQSDRTILLTSDNPEGRIIPLDPAAVVWIGIVVRKISEM